ncbi:MAG: T9SS type A sorting domain-containing protein, partial [Bacteroidia bacterium]
AVFLDCGQPVNGTTIGATPSTFSNNSPDVWYRLTNVSGNVTASLCGGTQWDSKIYVFRLNSGNPACGTMTSMGANDDFCGQLSQQTWFASAGETYYVVVAGATYLDYGNFTLTVTCTTVAPPNDDCISPKPITCGQTMVGSTVTASPDQGFPSPGVWYSIVGTGGPITASLCGSDFSTNLVVYQSNAYCNNPPFVAQGTGACPQGSEVTWNSVYNVTYWILVNGVGNSRGNYSLSVNCVTPQVPSNDHCTGAIPVTCNSTQSGTTIGATADNVFSSPGVWFQFTGTGGIVTMSLCNGTNFDSQLNVYRLANGSLSCLGPIHGVANNDDFCGENAQVTFASQLGVSYYVLLNGADASDFGNFTLEVSCPPDATPSNDLCDNPVTVYCGNDYSGTTIGATLDEPTGVSGTYGVWYFATGDDTQWTADLCKTFSGWDSRVWVLTGKCDGEQLFELGDMDDNYQSIDDFCGPTGLHGMATWFAKQGQQYYILVGGFKNATGNFTLSITGACSNPKMAGPTAAGAEPATALSVTALPNPSTDFVDFQVAVQQAGDARISLMNLAGQEVGTLDLGMIKEGNHTIRHEWKGVPAGIYLYSVTVGSEKAHGKLQVMH